jgi:hypothetical protein
MAITETKGTVSYLKVTNTVPEGQDLGLVAVRPTGGTSDEIYFIWWTATDPQPATAPLWLVRSMQVSLLRQAIASKLTVVIRHDSSILKSVEILA